MAPESSTLFRRSVDQHQRSKRRTPRYAVQGSLPVAAAGVAGLAFLAALSVMQRGERPGWWWLALIISGAVAAIGLIQIARALARPTKRVACPRCGTEERLYDKVTTFVCPNCRMLLLPGRQPSSSLKLSACANCGLETAVAPDHGRFLCPNCGVLRHSAAPEAIGLAQPCPHCGRPAPVGAIYCRACQGILFHDFSQPAGGTPELAYDLDWRSGQDATGHLHYARALLLHIDEAKGEDDLREVGIRLARLLDVLISAEEALQDPGLRPAVEAILPDVDRTYGALLQRAAALIAAQLGDPHAFWKGDLDVLAAELHIEARRRVERLLGPDALTASGGIGPWGENLIVVSVSDKRRDRVRSYGRLVEEGERFRAWEEQSRAAPPG